jgi:GDP-4-dehydro-6-deoxy-D-mannose reductase
LITGATGFAGSFLVEQYALEGWRVHGTFRDIPEDRSWIPAGVDLHKIDLTEAPAVSELVMAIRPDVVLHLAAQSSVLNSWRDPLGTMNTNAGSQLNLLDAVSAHAPEARVIVVGSCDEYGDVTPEANPVPEAHPLQPMSPYALSKVVQDLMGYQYFRLYSLKVIRTRPFLQIGPRRPDQFAVGSFARQVAEIAAGYRPPVIEVGNIHVQRDFTDVRDITRAYMLLAERGVPGDVYNIASGTQHSPQNIIEIMLDASGVQADIVQREERMRPGEPPLLIGDAAKLRAETGWSPRRTFAEAVIDTLKYWQLRVSSATVSRGES